ncbi:uncharacterized protein LOC143190568 [Rhynchophorus ferrugineus]|uniref:uncharacterized protein LOC143190568 n=1 Tax=Rhynchophorus ferrugineus TaxID=354439 RepID=UPI003FCD265F
MHMVYQRENFLAGRVFPTQIFSANRYTEKGFLDQPCPPPPRTRGRSFSHKTLCIHNKKTAVRNQTRLTHLSQRQKTPPKCANCGEPHTANYSGCQCRPAPKTTKLLNILP